MLLFGWRRWIPACLLPLLALSVSGPGAAQTEAPAPPAVGKVDPKDATVCIRVSSSLRKGHGSGFVVGDGGWVVTAYHVVAADYGRGRTVPAATLLALSPWTGRWYEAQLKAWDADADVALLRLETTGLPALPVDGAGLTPTTAALEQQAAAWKAIPLHLTGWAADTGARATPDQAGAATSETRLVEAGRRGKAAALFLAPVEGVQAGWSGGPVTRADTGAAIGVFHSVYRPNRDPEAAYPSASPLHPLPGLLVQAGAPGADFARPAAATLAAATEGRELVARQIRAMTLAAGRNLEQVEAEVREMVAREPDHPDAPLLMGLARAAAGDLDGAVRELRDADRRRPAGALVPLRLGLAQLERGEFLPAEAEFRRALARSPRESEARLGLGRALLAQGKSVEAEAVWKEARDGSPWHPWIRYRLGQLMLDAGRSREAVRELRIAAEVAGEENAFLGIRMAYARALQAEKQFAAAEREYRTVARRDPHHAESQLALARLLLDRGRVPEARLQLARLKRLQLTAPLAAALKEIEGRVSSGR